MARLLIASLDAGDTVEYLSHKADYGKDDTVIEMSLDEGTYCSWSNIDWDYGVDVDKYVISVYSPGSPNLEYHDLGCTR